MRKIIATIEKESEDKKLTVQAIHLTEFGRNIAHTLTCKEPSLTVQHCNVIIEVEKLNEDIENHKHKECIYNIDNENWLIRLRKLTPKEEWRLMGFSDKDFENAAKTCSNAQLYKQAGNSIVCDCLEAIFSQMNIKGVTAWNEKQKELGLST